MGLGREETGVLPALPRRLSWRFLTGSCGFSDTFVQDSAEGWGGAARTQSGQDVGAEGKTVPEAPRARVEGLDVDISLSAAPASLQTAMLMSRSPWQVWAQSPRAPGSPILANSYCHLSCP